MNLSRARLSQDGVNFSTKNFQDKNLLKNFKN